MRLTFIDPISAASAFLDSLAELPLSVWLDTGRSLNGYTALQVRQRAWGTLDVAIHSMRLASLAWALRDSVETLVFLKTREMGEATREQRRHLTSAHVAAEWAALAVLARDHLSDADFRAIVAPFDRCSISLQPHSRQDG